MGKISMMRHRRPLTLTALILVTLISGLAVRSQEKRPEEQDALKLTAELVQIDVLVLDKDNKPVRGLKAEDFELYDNDKPQKISFFSFEDSESRPFDEDAGRDRSLPRVITPKELKRVIAFVVDTLHMRTESVYRARKMLDDFVQKQMEPGDLVLILPTGGGSGLYQQFTSDQRVLRRAIGRLRPAYIFDSESPARRGGSSSEVIALLPALAEARANVPQAAGQGGAGGAATIGDALEEIDVRATLNSLDTMIKAVSRMPGRKVGVFISEGFRTHKTQQVSSLVETTHRAARANVVFYTIDPAGLDPIGLASADGKGVDMKTQPATDPLNPTGLANPPSSRVDLNNPLAAAREDRYASQESLSMLAQETGGKFFRNNNDIRLGLTSLLEENSGYYLLGFQPEGGSWDGKYHKLRVVLRGRPDLTVTTRKGYLARAEKPAARESSNPKFAEALEAISSPLVRRDIDIQLTQFYRDDTKREPVMFSLLHIAADKLTFKQAGGKYKTKLDMTGFVLDSAGKSIGNFGSSTELELEQKEYEMIQKQGLLWTHGIGVKPGAYQVKMLVREADSGFIGTASSYIEIPDLKSDSLALSSIFLDTSLFQQGKEQGSVSAGSTLSQRRYSRDGQFAYVFVVYNAKGDNKQTGLEVSTRILKNGQVVFAGRPKPVEVLQGSNLPSRVITGGIFQLAQLAPDDYVLEVTVVDKLRKKDNVTRQEIDFSIE
jgi:VWFA-related protein